ncbi:MAG: serine/threonine-protein kinase [Pseudonocardia sp.]
MSPGTRISDTLVVDRLLGEGAFAEVHRVEHEYLGWQAMKLFKRVVSLEQTREMLGEARLLSTLGHPNIVRLFDAGTVATTEGLRGFFTMEYIAGGSLDRLASSHRSAVPVEVAVEAAEQIADGLAAAHDQSPPIVHRDLTMANVLVGYDGTGMRVRISDFGLAKRADRFTLLASAQGTYAFLAPEVLRDEGYSCAGDVWSTGTIAYLLLTNHFPYEDDSGGRANALSSFSITRFRRPLLPPSRFNDDVDTALDAIVVAALDVDPRRRTPTARALVDALRERREAIGRHGGRDQASSAPATAEPPTERARRLADEALALARHPPSLGHAADLMEEAVNLSPRLRETYLRRLTVWRRGVTM